MNMFDTIDSLEESRTDWTLRVRLVREWDSYSLKGGREFKGKNLLLLDDKHARIHAFIWPNNIQDIKCDIVEGKIYTIRNVQVKIYRQESIKCIQSEKQLWFSNKTKMQPLENYDHMIAKNVFDFYNFAELPSLPQTLPKTQLIDVIGFLVDSDYNIRKITNTNEVEQTQVRFTLTDGRNTARFCFWDAFAIQFDAALKDQDEKPIIVIVSSCRYNLYKNEVHLSNLNPTRFFVNYDIPAVEHLRERYNNGAYKLSVPEEPVVEIPQIMTLQSIQKLPSEFIDKHVMCQVKVINIEERKKWWYYICNKGHDGLKIVEEEYQCDECKRIIPVPEKSFRLCVNVEDESGGATIVLFDREVHQIIGKNVYEVVNLQNKSGNKGTLPEIFKSIEGKQYTCTMKLTEANVKQRSCMYNAIDIFEGFEIVDNTQNQTDSSTIPCPTSEAQQSDFMSENQSISLSEFNTPDTEKSTTMKPAKRKIDNIVIDNMSNLNNVDVENKETKTDISDVPIKNIKKERE